MWIYRCIVDTEVRTDASTPHGKSRLQSFRHRPHTPATMQKPEDSVISRGRRDLPRDFSVHFARNITVPSSSSTYVSPTRRDPNPYQAQPSPLAYDISSLYSTQARPLKISFSIQRRRGHPSGTLFPAENPDSVQSARPASSVETGIVSTYEAVAQADNNDGPQNADQSPVTHALQPSKNATRSQEVRCPPRSVFTASNSEVESQVCNAEAQDAQERDLSFDQEQPKRIQL
ncbi:hypothetical protein B0J12DRAFT_701040 [Macrophomina phaseolina]|uniref:Uncharacterized protein n=1 Tax=Macrophomina phaseolina TaxID=35725 RepID=A0ABQ8G5Z1_9PEZI|nr:hypothetical protein B0J12DRAFT_701040 [Macrophomina phaseolina]